jgi:hypothetical protein
MIPLTFGVAILGEHARLTHLEINAPLLATPGTAVDRRIDKKVPGMTRDTALIARS